MTAAIDTETRATRRSAARLAKLRHLAFRKARRHTWTVKSLRFILPLAIVGMMATYSAVLYAKLGVKLGSGRLKVQAVEITPDDLKMKGVTYDGLTKDGGRYDVRAREAQVDISQKGPVRLTGIDGDLKQPNGVKTNLKSTRGILDNDKGEMDLFDGVAIDASNGLKARMKSAKVFNKENRVIAKEGVEADTATGRISARAMELQTKERKGVFTGDVAVRLTPDSASASSALGGGAGKDARLPIDVKAAKLDFDDTARLAVFSGGVDAVQGDSRIVAQALRITYEGRPTVPGLPGAAPVAAAAPAGDTAAAAATRLQKLHATGQITITQGVDRKVTADALEIDVPGDTALFTGPAVEVLQGQNRMLGRRLEIDRKAGKSRLSSPAEGKVPVGRIRTVFVQQEKQPGAAKKPAKPAGGEGSAGFLSFKTDTSAPMDIEAETLDVNDVTKQAIYRKAVRAQQGDFIITAAEVIANYTGETGLMTPVDGQGAKASGAPKGQSPQISRIDANDNVVITSKDGQEARGKKAVYDAKTNTVVMSGGVFVKQGENQASGVILRIDMTTGIAQFDNDGSQPSIGTAAAPAVAVKSAPGPGGLPQIGGVQLPTAPTPVGAGRQSLTVFPNTIKKGEDGKNPFRSAVPKAASPADKQPAPPRKPSDAWQPTTSPSPVYRSP